MPRNSENNVCTVCNRTVYTYDSESDSGSVFGSVLEEVTSRSHPAMKNSKQLGNLDSNKMYPICGICTQMFRRKWQIWQKELKKGAMKPVENGAGSNVEASTSKGKLKSSVGEPANAISSIDEGTNINEPSANSSGVVDLENGYDPLELNDRDEEIESNDNVAVTDTQGDAPRGDLDSTWHNSTQNWDHKNNCGDCTITGTSRSRNDLGLLPFSPPAGRKDGEFLIPPPRDTLLKKQSITWGRRPQAPTPPRLTELPRVNSPALYSEGDQDVQAGVAEALSPTTLETVEVVDVQSSEAKPSNQTLVVGPKVTPAIPPAKEDGNDGTEQAPGGTSRKHGKVVCVRLGNKLTYSKTKTDSTFTYKGDDIPTPRRRRSRRLSATNQPLASSSSSSNDVDDNQSTSEVDVRNESVTRIPSDTAGRPVPSTSSGTLEGISPPCTNQYGTKKPKTAVQPLKEKKKEVPKGKSSQANAPVKKGKSPAKKNQKDVEPPKKRAKYRHCCHLCPGDFDTKTELKNHWLRYHRINPAALMPSP